jgi:hypothetical protein
LKKTTALALAPDRVAQVYQWIITGASEFEIVEAVEKTWPGAKARPLILSAIKKIANNASPDADTINGWCFEASRHVYQRAIEVGNFNAALRAIRQMATFATEK